MGAEFLVDWVKHAFITRFNPELSVELYKVYTTNLAYDLAITKQEHVSSKIINLLYHYADGKGFFFFSSFSFEV